MGLFFCKDMKKEAVPRMSSLPSDLTTDRDYNGKVALTMKETSNPTLAKYWAE